jgi:hypothetical protein
MFINLLCACSKKKAPAALTKPLCLQVEELLNALKPRGSECPYDQTRAVEVLADTVDKIVVRPTQRYADVC